MGELIFMPVPSKLSASQREHWEQQLIYAETAVETALRMLGRLPLEGGLSETSVTPVPPPKGA